MGASAACQQLPNHARAGQPLHSHLDEGCDEADDDRAQWDRAFLLAATSDKKRGAAAQRLALE